MADSGRAIPSRPIHRGPRVAVVGGGLAGLAAAAGAAERGLGVELFEAQGRLGGRAGSFHDPRTGSLVDFCQHIWLGCCTNLADLCRRTGIADCFVRRHRWHVIGPGGSRCRLGAAPFLPAPLHLAPGLLRLGYLSLADRLGIARAMMRLARGDGGPEGDTATIGRWLERAGASRPAREWFWSVILVSALSETLDRASLDAARQVFMEGFLASRRGHEMEVPRLPLGEIFDGRLAAWLVQNGVVIHRGRKVKQMVGGRGRIEALVTSDGRHHFFDLFVVAVPWRRVRGLFPETVREALPAVAGLDRLEPAPITAVHLWFDRPITRLADAVLVGRLGQWLFSRGPQALCCSRARRGYYYQVVISASHALRGRRRAEVIHQIRQELAGIWPAAGRAELVHGRVITQPGAVFSCRPGIDQFRPPQVTPIRNLLLAGDWTATGWPATMEGAVRSGRLAIEGILQSLGRPDRLLVEDLPRGRLAKWLLGGHSATS